MYCLFCVVLCIVCVYVCTVLLPPGGYPAAVYKHIISIRMCRSNVVGIATRLRAGRSEVQIQVGARRPDRL